MRALVRTLLAVIGVLGVVMVAAVVYITTFFDPNDLKPRLIEVVREQSGLELTLDGPLSWSFYPRLGVSVEQAEAWLSERSEDEVPFAAFQRAEVSLAFAPLLSGNIAIDGLILEDMHLNLKRDEQGHGNWQVLLDRLDERGEQAESALAPAASGPNLSEGGMNVALNIASVQVRDSKVFYSDRQNNHELRFSALNISGTNVNPNRPFPLRTSFSLASFPDASWRQDESASPELTSNVSFESRVRLGLADGRYVLENVVLDTQTSLNEWESRKQQANLKAVRVIAELREDRYQIEGGALDASFSHPAMGERALPLSLSFVAEADLNAETLQLRNLQLTGEDNLKLNGELAFSDLLDAPRYSGQIRMTPMSLRPWLSRFGKLPQARSESAFSDVALTSPVRGDLQRGELTNLTLVLDGSTFTGRMGGAYDGSVLSFDLQGDALDLDAYRPADVASSEAASFFLPGIDAAYAQEAGAMVPVDWLREASLDGRLALERLEAFGLSFSDIGVQLAGQQGQHRFERFEAGFYDGTLRLPARLDVSREPIQWTFNPTLERVQIAPLYEALQGESSPLRGRLNVNGELTSRGNTQAALKRNLNGRTNLRIVDGAMLDVNISQELCTVAALLEGEQTTRDWSPDTRFDRAQATLIFRDGVVHNDDLELTLPGIALGGKGELDLGDMRFDYRAQTRFVDTADAACNVNPRLERLPLPVRCEGVLGGQPSEWCGFDRQAFQQAVGQLARDEVERRAGEEFESRVGKALENLDERIGEEKSKELRDALRGLFQ
ncbi:AsmA family protein [Litchfieldella xinjiangensis]|uniref:AsmA family protein n=1 Tax=Litchfieldella xinjiangensis TaxID=1166948 RepID=UPI0005BDECBA|nr:AsmA family protein [Halomonas xinjiangensis]